MKFLKNLIQGPLDKGMCPICSANVELIEDRWVCTDPECGLDFKFSEVDDENEDDAQDDQISMLSSRSTNEKDRRLNLMRRYLWEILIESKPLFQSSKKHKTQAGALKTVKNDPYLSEIADLSALMLLTGEGKQRLKKCLDDFLNNAKDYANRSKQDPVCPKLMRDAFMKTSKLDVSTQKSIGYEVIDFICSKDASRLRFDLITLNLSCYICSYEPLGSLERDLKQIIPFIFRSITLDIATTPWTEEFKRLGKLSPFTTDSQHQWGSKLRKTRSVHSGKGFAASNSKRRENDDKSM